MLKRISPLTPGPSPPRGEGSLFVTLPMLLPVSFSTGLSKYTLSLWERAGVRGKVFQNFFQHRLRFLQYLIIPEP